MRQQQNPILFLPVESVPRELDYKLNIARFFCNKGFDVIIGNPPFIRDELKYKNYRGIFLEKGMNPTPEYYKDLKDKGILLYCLSDEGASFPAYSVTYPPAVESLKCAEKIFMWGEFQKKDLISRYSDYELNEKYLVTGYPSFDLSLPIYKKYHTALRPSSLDKDYILINTNFASVNGYSPEEILEACPNMSPETKKSIEKSYEDEEKSFKLFEVWLTKIIQKFPQQNFLIRPHPVEKKEVYDMLAAHYKNVYVSREGNANQVISGAKLVIHNDCTTALQSYLSDVPVISLAHSNKEYIRASWAIEFGAKPSTLDEAISLVSDVLKNGHFEDDLRESIHVSAQTILCSMFHNAGKSTQYICNLMLDDFKSQSYVFEKKTIIDTRSLLHKMKVFIRKFLPLHYKVPMASRVPLSEITIKDIEQRLFLLNKIEDIKKTYKIKTLFPNTFLIQEIK